MSIVGIEGLRSAIRVGSRLLGLDVGGKTVGLALSDETLLVATPLLTLRRKRFSTDAAALAETVSSNDVGGLVIGLPVSMDGSEGPRCQSVRQFADNLRHHVDIPMAFWDERWSTKVVERMLVAEADISRRRRRQVVDKLAAAYILQGALDFVGTRHQHSDRPNSERQQ
ncbi:MAG: Holliday junction resolvase RuvX [Rhodospirillales bacterium]|nr:Holliday junction resolvase RuvX [Rhodospirillales bacterium]